LQSQWGLVFAKAGYHFINNAAKRIGCLTCVNNVFVPVLHERPCLGALFLAQWPLTSIQAWHEITALGVRPIGQWPLAAIADSELDRFKAELLAAEGAIAVEPAPCAPGDRISFVFPGVNNAIGYCLWTNERAVGVKFAFLGRDNTLTLPFGSIIAVLPQ
jgi:hypothetical protein